MLCTALLSRFLLAERFCYPRNAATVCMAGCMSLCKMSNRRASAPRSCCDDWQQRQSISTGAIRLYARGWGWCLCVRVRVLSMLHLLCLLCRLFVLSLQCVGRWRPNAYAAVWMSGALTVRMLAAADADTYFDMILRGGWSKMRGRGRSDDEHLSLNWACYRQ